MYRLCYAVLSCILFIFFCCEETRGFTPVMPGQQIRTFTYSFDAVWSGLLTLIEKQDIDLLTVDKELGSIITDFIPLDPRSPTGRAALFPEKGERAIEKAKYDMVIVVRRLDENKASVHVDVHLGKYSRSSFISYYKWNDQLSNGYIEKKLFDDLETVLK